MRHTPCGCRSAHLVEVRSNHRLPEHSTMRRAPAMPLFRKQSAAEVTSLAPHDSKARLLSGRDSQGFMAKPCTPHLIPQAAQLFELQSRNVGVEGDSPRLSLGDSKGVFSSEREYPLWCRAHASPPPALARENQGTPLEKGVKKTRHICGRSFSELISNNACCGSYGRPRSSCGA